MMKRVGVSGEQGDATYCLPAIRALGIRRVLNLDRPYIRPDWKGRSKSLKRLAEAQSYIDSWEDHAGQDFLDLTTYRQGGMGWGETIVSRICRWARVPIDYSQWLEVDPNPKTKDRIIVSRCPRWKAYSWPWKALVATFGREMMFIGTTDEYRAFCAEFGYIERLHCNDLMDVAQAIQGSALFIGNQSCPNAICEGLKHDSVVEVCPFAPDTNIPRDNVVRSVDGEMSFTALGKTFTHPAIVQPYVVEVGDKIAYGKSPFECETVARTLYLLQNLPSPSIADIQAKIRESR